MTTFAVLRRDTRRHRLIRAIPVAWVWALLVSCTTAPASDSGTDPTDPPTVAASPEPSSSHPVRVGFVGLPPEGATPSRPEVGELVLSLQGAVGGPHDPHSELWSTQTGA
jgi:hypothetical protein